MTKKNISLKYGAIPPLLDKGDDFDFRVVVETPRGSRHKYALDPKIGAFVLKQTLGSGLSWPYDYGFIPQTLGEDGDPLDILVLMDEPSFPGCVMQVRLLGAITVRKDGAENDRFVSCLRPSEETSLSTDGYKDITDLPKKLLREMEHFLKNYASERGDECEIKGAIGRKDALKRIHAGAESYKLESE